VVNGDDDDCDDDDDEKAFKTVIYKFRKEIKIREFFKQETIFFFKLHNKIFFLSQDYVITILKKFPTNLT
jgi:hypothetical protein